MLDIGNEYKTWGVQCPNGSPLFWLLQNPVENLNQFKIDPPLPIYQTLERLNTKLSELERIQLDRLDALLIEDEVRLTIEMMRHACKRAIYLYDNGNKISHVELLRENHQIIVKFKTLWLKRNRIGGLTDSLVHFDTLIKEYESANE